MMKTIMMMCVVLVAGQAICLADEANNAKEDLARGLATVVAAMEPMIEKWDTLETRLKKLQNLLRTREEKAQLFVDGAEANDTAAALLSVVLNTRSRLVGARMLTQNLKLIEIYKRRGERLPVDVIKVAREAVDQFKKRQVGLAISLPIEKQWKLNTDHVKPESRELLQAVVARCYEQSVMAEDVAGKAAKVLSDLVD